MTTQPTTLDELAATIAADLACNLALSDQAERNVADYIRDRLRPLFEQRDALLHMLVRLATESRRPGGPLYATVAEALTLATSIDGGDHGGEGGGA